ncbi:MAG: beta-Ala-His dipeptidase [Pirellulaceae bacterium]
MADSIFEPLEPKLLWRRFLELKNTPRPSKHEQQAIDYLRDWATRHGYETRTDEVGNLCVRVPATAGCENAPTVVLQNHVDIVAANVENAPSDADASRGLIPVDRGEVNEAGQFEPAGGGGWIGAPLTTLGADNGIGCAAAMAVCELDNLRHPSLELLFTIDEEEGMSGALRLDAEALGMRGRILLNLDTESDDELTIGSAGGCDLHVRWEASLADAAGWVPCALSLADLRGGHSGIEINSGRANAIRLMATALGNAAAHIPLRVATLAGGDRRNAIPRSCRATVLVQATDVDALQNFIATCCDLFNRQFAGRDNPVEIETQRGLAVNAAFSQEDTRRLLDLLLAIPDGVFAMTAEIPDLPETSNNLALISTDDQVVTIHCSSRSSHEPGMRDILSAFHAVGRMAGAEVREGNSYPGWKPDLKSRILASTHQVYQRLFNEEAKVMAVHAGLECGVLASRIPELDCISFGPNICGNHAPGEHVQIASVDKSFRLLTELLAELAMKTGVRS